mmetsp:Transcript_45543/g.69710  ORF Transcript_45543/g.69710 Transcript_45543/m.69710 type:complete len:96 (+) Transcript_45543:207-494(+)
MGGKFMFEKIELRIQSQINQWRHNILQKKKLMKYLEDKNLDYKKGLDPDLDQDLMKEIEQEEVLQEEALQEKVVISAHLINLDQVIIFQLNKSSQ